jgi:hypothetical protein
VSRFVDRGATYAALVGVGMAMTIAVSFLLVIPIEPVVWLLGPLGAILIGYYADTKADRRAGPWPRILANAVYAGAVTALSLAVLILVTKAVFFYADGGYPNFNRVDPETRQPIPPSCQTGAGCVYARYLADARSAELVAAGITDVDSFTSFYWREQLQTAGTIAILGTAGGLLGGVLYGISRPKASRPAPTTSSAAGPGTTTA